MVKFFLLVLLRGICEWLIFFLYLRYDGILVGLFILRGYIKIDFCFFEYLNM